jgi:hypothetical protein
MENVNIKGELRQKSRIPRVHWDRRIRFCDFRIYYLDEYEAICETALARESGPWVGLIDEKT